MEGKFRRQTAQNPWADIPFPQDPCMIYLPTFTINFSQMQVNIPYMDSMDCTGCFMGVLRMSSNYNLHINWVVQIPWEGSSPTMLMVQKSGVHQ